MKWNPYPETKPRVGTSWLVWRLADSGGYWEEGRFTENETWENVFGEEINVTHWMDVEPPSKVNMTRLTLVHAFGEIQGATFEEVLAEFSKLPSEQQKSRYVVIPTP